MTGNVWFISQCPTPQRVPTFDDIAVALPHARFLYLHAGDGGRGWGEIELSHPAIFWNRLTRRERMRIARRLAFRGANETAICFGYRGLARLSALAGARLRGAPVIVRSDTNQRDIEGEPKNKRLIRKILLRLAVPPSTIAWTIGSENERFWRTEAHLSRTIRIPYESPILPGMKSPSEIPARHSDPTAMRILYVGRLIPLKRVGDLISAFQSLDGRGYEGWTLTIVGDGPLRHELACLAASDGRIQFLGPVDFRSLGNVMGAADVLVLPSETEPWGLVVNEALGYGLYVIASDAVGSAYDLLDATTGTQFPVRDVSALTVALRRSAGYVDREPRNPGTSIAERMLKALNAI